MPRESDSHPASAKRFWTRRRRATVSVLLALAIVAVTVFHRPLFFGNWGEVEPGRVYRSAQPAPDAVDATLRNHGIAAVLNLRGGSLRDPWYVAELRAVNDQKITFYDLEMKATRRPTRNELLALWDILDKCPYPLLIHCKSGSDRTGLASALYLMIHGGEPPEKAINAFTIWYGHVPLFGPETLHEPIWEYAAWLRDNHLVHNKTLLRSWMETVYASSDDPEDYAPPKPGSRWDH